MEANITMSRTAQDVLEFDKLRELLRLRTTCAPGRRAVNGLEPGMDRAALESAFALIREAGEWLRAGRELGFGALADPQSWLARIEGRGAALEPGEFLDAASLLETRSEEHTSELQSRLHLVCRLLLEKKKKTESNPVVIVHARRVTKSESQ